jgi:hypothetical protein
MGNIDLLARPEAVEDVDEALPALNHRFPGQGRPKAYWHMQHHHRSAPSGGSGSALKTSKPSFPMCRTA